MRRWFVMFSILSAAVLAVAVAQQPAAPAPPNPEAASQPGPPSETPASRSDVPPVVAREPAAAPAAAPVPVPTPLPPTAPPPTSPPMTTTPSLPDPVPGPERPAGQLNGARPPMYTATPQGAVGSPIVITGPPYMNYTTLMASPGVPVEYLQAEREAADLAKAYRDASDKLGDQHPEQVARREALEKAVQKAFQIRHEEQQKELAQLKRRFEKAESNVAKRANNRDKIIRKRVDELLGDDDSLNWTNLNTLTNGTPYGAPATNPMQFIPSLTPPVNTYERSVNGGAVVPATPVTPGRQLPSNFPPTLENRLLSAPTTPSPGFITTAAPAQGSAFPPGFAQRDELRSIRREINGLEETIRRMKEQIPADVLDKEFRFHQSVRQLEAAKQKLAQRKMELETNVKLLQLDVETAHAQLNAAREELNLQKAQVERGTAPTSGLPQLEAKFQQASAAVQRAEILLELNKKSLDDPDQEQRK